MPSFSVSSVPVAMTVPLRRSHVRISSMITSWRRRLMASSARSAGSIATSRSKGTPSNSFR